MEIRRKGNPNKEVSPVGTSSGKAPRPMVRHGSPVPMMGESFDWPAAACESLARGARPLRSGKSGDAESTVRTG
jgi:hypothetical protein